MSNLPSWARKGAKVECIVKHHGRRGIDWGYGDEVMPVVGNVYTVRDIHWSEKQGWKILVEEIVNPVHWYSDGPHEGSFCLHRFRPVLDIKDDAEVEMALYYKKSLHQSVSRKKSVDA